MLKREYQYFYHMIKRMPALLMLLMLGTVLWAEIGLSAETGPNILFIMADDHSPAAVGAYKSHLAEQVITPNIDRLAREGAMLNNCVSTNSLCAPSRASIITGTYSHKNGVFTLREELNTAGSPTLAKLFHAGGYQTAVIGKWHIHGDNLQGYDYYAITRSQGSYFNPSLSTKEGKLRREGHSTEVYTDLSMDWLKTRDKDKPFLLMTHYKATHGPWHYNPVYEDLYRETNIPEPETLFDNYEKRDPNGVPKKAARIHESESKNALSYWFQYGKKGKGEWATGNMDMEGLSEEDKTNATYQKYLKDYLRCVKGIDDGVGKLIRYLEKEGILDNTIIVYTSDQGMYLGEHGFFDKRLGLEEGMKIPFIIRYPASIRPGTEITELVNTVDFAPTFLEFAGISIPGEMQGIPFRDILVGESTAARREVSFYQFYSSGCPTHYGIRTQRYKLLKYTGKDGSVQGADLYDLEEDPNELKSIYEETGALDIRSKMEELLAEEMKNIDLKEGFIPGQQEWKNHVEYPKKEKTEQE